VAGRLRRRFLVAAAASLVLPRAMHAQPSHVVQRDGFRATVRTLGYNQAASFYVARRLPNQVVKQYAGACVILVSAQNALADTTISLRLADWRVRTEGGGLQRIRGRSSWLAELDRQGASTASRMAFEWAQMPEEVDLGGGDSVQGMLSVPVARESPFELILHWQSGLNRNEATIRGVRCD